MSAPKTTFICAACSRALGRSKRTTNTVRAFSTGSTCPSPATTAESRFEDRRQIPRWQQTPPAMKMPFRLRKKPDQPEWKVNHDPKRLDVAIDHFIGDAIGPGVKGSEVLSEEVKWLTVTHKSFEQGARGFNDKLAFLGKRIVDIETCKQLLKAPPGPLPALDETIDGQDNIGPRKQHPALERVENITSYAKESMVSPKRMAWLSAKYGISKVVRWQPRQVEHLAASGSQGVMAGALYAIVGAVALQRGSEVAKRLVNKRIISQLSSANDEAK